MLRTRSSLRVVVGLALVLGLILPAMAPAPACADPSLQINGKTVGEWTAQWWQWALAIPADVNPMIGNNSPDINQKGKMWFLAGVWGGGSATRTSKVPKGRQIFFPIANGMWIQTPLDNPNLTEADWRNIVSDMVTPYGNTLECTLDGNPVIFNYLTPIVRTQTAVFTATFPTDNVFGMDPSYLTGYPIVSDGYWVVLPPLPRGQHVLWFRSGGSDAGVTYNLNVK